MIEQLDRSGFLAVVGASGSGKSSVVRAGIVAAIRRREIPANAEWRVLVLTPGAYSLMELAAGLSSAGAAASPTTLLHDLDVDVRTLGLTVRQVLPPLAHDARLLLVVDQFEEIFTLCQVERERDRFVQALVEAVTPEGARVSVVLAMRADLYGRCARYPALASLLESNHTLLGEMSEVGLRAAIEEPARVAALAIEPAATERILADFRGEPGGLPLLSHALLETWKRRR